MKIFILELLFYYFFYAILNRGLVTSTTQMEGKPFVV
jgi:hypothetical protein